MNNQEARFILSAYRPNGLDRDDAQMRGALDHAAGDPALMEWFRAGQEFDRAFAHALQSIPPPADLRAGVLAGARVSHPRRWDTPIWAIAAAVALVATIAAFLFPWFRPPEFAGWQEKALSYLSGTVILDRQSPDTAELQEWLRANRSPAAGAALPPALAGLKAAGCKTLTWNGTPVSIICFHLGGDRLVHLVIVNRDSLPSAPPFDSPRFASSGHWNTASWSTGDKSMMLATDAPVDVLKRLL
jgi:hypothetical protein